MRHSYRGSSRGRIPSVSVLRISSAWSSKLLEELSPQSLRLKMMYDPYLHLPYREANIRIQVDTGTHIMIAGLIFQVVSLATFVLLCCDFALRLHKNRNSWNTQNASIYSSWKFKAFLYCKQFSHPQASASFSNIG